MSEGVRIAAYDEAFRFHQTRTTLLANDYYDRALDAVRPRAMTVTGLHKLASLTAITRIFDNGIANNKTTSDIADEISAVVDAHGGTILSGDRIELIVHNALYMANAAGDWNAAMEFVEDRPYFEYRGPVDDRNSRICKPLNGTVVHYTDPLLKHLWHPNHHRERHEWVPIATNSVYPEKVYRSPEGYEYPVINGQVVRPADGWDFNPADAMAADDAALARSARVFGEQLERKTSRDYGLRALVDIEGLPPLPRLANSVPAGAIGKAWERFQEVVGITNGSGVTVLDYAGEGVRINRDSFELALLGESGSFNGGNGRYFPLILPTLEDPAEVWLVPRVTDQGTSFIKRYIGAFAARGGVRTLVLDRTDAGWLWQTIAPEDTEPYRTGLLVRTRARKHA